MHSSNNMVSLRIRQDNMGFAGSFAHIMASAHMDVSAKGHEPARVVRIPDGLLHSVLARIACRIQIARHGQC